MNGGTGESEHRRDLLLTDHAARFDIQADNICADHAERVFSVGLIDILRWNIHMEELLGKLIH